MTTTTNLYQKTRINMKIEANSLVDGSNIGPVEYVICSLTLGACEFKHKVIACKDVLASVILGLDSTQNFRVGTDSSKQGQLYLHQDHKPLTYSKPKSSKD